MVGQELSSCGRDGNEANGGWDLQEGGPWLTGAFQFTVTKKEEGHPGQGSVSHFL